VTDKYGNVFKLSQKTTWKKWFLLVKTLHFYNEKLEINPNNTIKQVESKFVVSEKKY
jgi:hypothetical protein